MADRVSLSNMVFYAFHGAFDAERELGQRFEVDVDIYTDVRAAGQADDLDLGAELRARLQHRQGHHGTKRLQPAGGYSRAHRRAK